MMKLDTHTKDTRSYCFTSREAGKAGNLAQVVETRERMHYSFGGRWVPAGERGK